MNLLVQLFHDKQILQQKQSALHLPGTHQAATKMLSWPTPSSSAFCSAVSSHTYALKNPTACLKSDYIRRYGRRARMFNAIRVTLEGRMSGATESQKLHRQTLEGLIARADKQLVALV